MRELTFGPGGHGLPEVAGPVAAPGTVLRVDLNKLLAGRLAVQGNSGSGKSWLLRTLLEGTHGAVQHLVVDPEGEYRTLREVFDDYVILAGEGGDLDVTPDTTERPVAELVRAGANVVLDLSDFDQGGRDAVCAAATNALMALSAPRLAARAGGRGGADARARGWP